MFMADSVSCLDPLCTYKLRVGGFSGIAAGAASVTDEIRIVTA
jgi:hypothetical protein